MNSERENISTHGADSSADASTKPPPDSQLMSRPRRNFLLIFSTGVFASISAAIAAAAFRFLRPTEMKAANANGATGEAWVNVAPVAELTSSDAPLRREVVADLNEGWARSRVSRAVFVLPQQNNRVLSAACPHQGCNVEWDASARSFVCPCHDSHFDANGKVLTGPARSDLAVLPSRVQDGTLQVQLTATKEPSKA